MSVAVSIQESTVPAPARVDWTMKACLLLVPHTHTHTHTYKLLDEGVLPAGTVCMYVCICKCTCICTCTCTCIYIYIYGDEGVFPIGAKKQCSTERSIMGSYSVGIGALTSQNFCQVFVIMLLFLVGGLVAGTHSQMFLLL